MFNNPEFRIHGTGSLFPIGQEDLLFHPRMIRTVGRGPGLPELNAPMVSIRAGAATPKRVIATSFLVGSTAFPQGSLWRERPPAREGQRVSGPLSTFDLPRAAPAAKKGGSLSPPAPPLVRRAVEPGEGGTREAQPRFTYP